LPPVRALLAVGGLVIALGTGLLVWGVRQQVAGADCPGRCGSPESWPVAVGILVLLCGGFLFLWAIANGFAARTLHSARREVEERERLRRVGVMGTARILNSEDEGTGPAGETLVSVELAVTVPGLDPYEVRHRTPVPRWLTWRLRLGRPLPVLVDPEDPHRLLVEWGRLPPRRG
jgi:hypothetical protein